MNIAESQSSIFTGMAFRACMERKPAGGEFSELLKYTTKYRQQEDETAEAEESEVKEARECVKNYGTVLVKEILYGTSDEEYRKAKKNNKKYQLFRADNGAFGDKTLEEHVNPSKNRKATWNSAESKKLTKQQIRYLKGKYNVSDMSDEEFDGFIMELVDMKLLSAKEAEEILTRKLPAEILEILALLQGADDTEDADYIE